MKRAVFILLLITIVSLIFYGCTHEADIQQSIINYCKSNEKIRLKDVTKFDWDIAYLDYQVYGGGQNLKDLYGIEGSLEGLNSEEQFAIAFCKKGKLVKYVICSSFKLIFGESLPSSDKETSVIYPGTVFSVEWKTDSSLGSSTLHLLLEK